jgi:hypothetical protein
LHQEHIERENARLEAAQTFETREILIRIEYKFCPNMIIIDTPGLIHAPRGRGLTLQQQAMADAARDAETLVAEKMRCKEYLILCVEDTTDWKHATTRNIVMQVYKSFAMASSWTDSRLECSIHRRTRCSPARCW